MSDDESKRDAFSRLTHPAARDAQSDMAQYAGMGLQFAATICLLAFVGYKLDEALGSLPIFLIVGVFLGFLGGMLSMVKRVASLGGTDHREQSTDEPPQAD